MAENSERYIQQKNIFYLFFPLTFLLQLYFLFAAEGVYDTGDGVMHYMFSRYAIKHPALFLDLWGKPVFMLLSFPFAQLGYKGIVIFNLLCGQASCYFSWKSAEKLGMRYAWTAAVFLLFSSMYFGVVQSGLTEPLFGLVLIAGIYLILLNRYIAALIILSFLPFVRSEGFLLLPLVALWMLTRGEWKRIPFLATGFVLFSIVGYYHFENILWVIQQNPYDETAAIYGHGTLLHFVADNEYIWGWPLTICMSVSLIAILFQFVKWRFTGNNFAVFFGFILMFLVYLTAHSLFWYLGVFSSLGLTRVMAAIMPCAAVMGTYGLNAICDLSGLKYWKIATVSVCIAVQIPMPFKIRHFPFRASPQEKTLARMKTWTDENMKGRKPLFAQDPLVDFALNRDHFDPLEVRQLWAFDAHNMDENAILVWDSHFAAIECGLPLEKLNNDSLLTLQWDSFASDDPNKTDHYVIFSRQASGVRR